MSQDTFDAAAFIKSKSSPKEQGPSDPSANEEEKAKASLVADKRKWRIYYTDAELGKRFLAEHSGVRFISEHKEWMLYDETTGVWAKGNDSDVRAYVQPFLLKEYKEAEKDGKFTRLDSAEVCLRVQTARRVVEWIEAEVRTVKEAFDTHKDLVVVANGVVDLRTSELKPFDPSLYFTRRIPYPYEAGCRNKWTDLAIESLPEDARDQFKIMAGQALTGYQTSRSTLFFLWGDGSNGKSTIIDLLSATAGGFGGKPKKDVLLKQASSSNFHTIGFKGIRQAIIEEIPDEKFLDGGVVRDLAGTTDMTGEHKGKDPETYEVQATIFISFNNRPQVTETAHAVWRRLVLIEFPYTYVATEAELTSPSHRLQNPMLKDLHRKSEKAVIAFLAWRIEGARLWYEAGMKDPEDAPSVTAATRKWKLANDAIAHWYEENLVADPDYFILLDDLLADFNQWRNSPKTAWGKNSLIEKFSSHSVFRENGLEYKRAARHKGLKQSIWERDNAPEWEKARIAKLQATYVKGVRFRSDLDSLTIPSDTSELDAEGNLEDELSIWNDEDTSDEGVTF